MSASPKACAGRAFCFRPRESVRYSEQRHALRLKATLHQAEEGSYYTEIPAAAGLVMQGDAFEKPMKNLHGSVEGGLSVKLEGGRYDPR